jgi:hypothetical protein
MSPTATGDFLKSSKLIGRAAEHPDDKHQSDWHLYHVLVNFDP